MVQVIISLMNGSKHTKCSKVNQYSIFLLNEQQVCCSVVGEIILKPLSILLGSTPTILPYTEDYMGTILLGTNSTSSLTLINQMRFQGKICNVGIITGTLINVVLEILCLYLDLIWECVDRL